MKQKLYFLFVLLIIPFHLAFSNSSKIYKLFGASKEHYKNVLIFSPYNSEFSNGTLGVNYFEDFLSPFGIRLTTIQSEIMFNNKGVMVDDLINYFSDKGKNKYSIIYLFTHGDRDTLLVEMYSTPSERNNRLLNLNNDPRFQGKNYFKIGHSTGNPDTYAIAITYNFVKDFFKHKGSLVIVGGCHAGAFGFTAFNPAGAVASIGWDQPDSETNYDLDLGEEIGYLLCAMTGTRSKTISEKKSIQSINYSIDEIKKSGNKVLKTLSIWLRNPNDGDYVLYQQPRIDDIEVKARKKGSTDLFNRLIYKYSYSGTNKFNPIEEYPGTELLEKAHKGLIEKDDELHVSLDFSNDILVDKQSDSFERTDVNGYLFKLCVNISKYINEDQCIDIEKDSLISFNTKRNIDKETGEFISNSSKEISIRFDLTDFEKKDITLNSQTRLYFVAKSIDSYSSDGMFFLDTNGNGREDGMTWAVVDGQRNYENSDTNSSDGLDTNHWFNIAPKIETKQSSIYNLHYPQVLPGEDPPSVPIYQTLISDSAPPVDIKKVQYLFDTCDKLTGLNKFSCIMDATAQAMALFLPTFYLGPSMLPDGSATPVSKEPIELATYDAKGSSLEESLKPVYIAIVKTIDDNPEDNVVPKIEPLARSDVFRDEVKLYLESKEIIPNTGEGNNRLSGISQKADISDLYDIYLVKDAPDQALVVLPLKRLYEGPDAPSLPDGSHTIRIETSPQGDNDEDKKDYKTSLQLTYVKDFQVGQSTGSQCGGALNTIKDYGSGFSNTMLNYAYAVSPTKSGFINDMALNKIKIPLTKDQKIDSSSDTTTTDNTIPSSPSDDNYKPPKTCTQYNSLSCHREVVDPCHYARVCDSYDFAVCLLPFPYVSNPTNNTTWDVFKENDISCENNEDYGYRGKFGVIFRGGEPVTGGKPEPGPEVPVEYPQTPGAPQETDDKDAKHPPEVKSIRAVRDDDSPTGISLECEWEDEDGDLVPTNTRIFIMPDFDLNKFRELNITKDYEEGNVSDSGCILKNIPDLTEGKFGVKVHIEDEEAYSDDEVKLLNIAFDPPKITDVAIDKDNMLITAVVSDEGTPIDKLKLDFPVVYNFTYVDNQTAKFTVPIPPQLDKNLYKQYLLKVQDLALQSTQKNFYRDIYPPDGSMNHDESEKKLVTDVYDVDFESGVDLTRLDLIIDGVIYKNYKIEKAGDIYKIIFQSSYLNEGTHTGYVKACDYNDNCSTTKPEIFHVAWPPEINYFYHETNKSSNAEYLDAKVWDKGKNLDPAGFELNIDGAVIPPTAYSYDPVSMMFYYYPAVPFTAGSHTATLTARDTTGLFDQETITFTSTGITNLILTNKNYRDIEGNGDGIINEGERIYLDLEVTNRGDGATQNTWGELINRSEYIKGVAEGRARYGFIQSGGTAYNDKPFEFVVNDKVFEREDIDRVEAEFVLRLSEIDYYSGATKTTDIPFTLVIERMDPMTALFELSVVKPPAQTMDPAFRLEGSWKTFGTDLKSLDIRITQDSLPPSTSHSLAAFQKDLTVVKNDAGKTFYTDATLGIGDNRFVVTATADNGVVRTAEVSIKLTSQVGIELDKIADTKEPNVTVTGEAWTTNSRLENVKIYLNGGFAGDAVVDGGGRFSLPVTLNGGENIIRAVARDDQGKSASDEITVNMHGPLMIRWERAHQRVNETPIAACGSYETDGDNIATIVTYVNDLPNTYETVINRDLKTFCTTADLQAGNNILRAVGTTTGGVTAEAFSRVEYGGLSITMNPLPAYTTSVPQTISGSYTLSTEDPFTIEIVVQGLGWTSYTPTIDPFTKTFTVDVSLFDCFSWCSDLTEDCGCISNNEIFATINQGSDSAWDYREITVGQPIINNGVEDFDPDLCEPVYSPEGWIEGSFIIVDPSIHINDIIIHTEDSYGDKYYTVTDWSELTGRFRFEFTDFSGWYWQVLINATDGNTYGCRGNNCAGSIRPPDKQTKKNSDSRKIVRPLNKEQRRKIKDKD